MNRIISMNKFLLWIVFLSGLSASFAAASVNQEAEDYYRIAQLEDNRSWEAMRDAADTFITKYPKSVLVMRAIRDKDRAISVMSEQAEHDRQAMKERVAEEKNHGPRTLNEWAQILRKMDRDFVLSYLGKPIQNWIGIDSFIRNGQRLAADFEHLRYQAKVLNETTGNTEDLIIWISDSTDGVQRVFVIESNMSHEKVQFL